LTTLAGVLGFPVAHSRSPAMMNAAFAVLGLDWRYLPLPASPERFEEIARALPGSGYRGANVTIPHKLAAHALADELGEAAAAIGAVNTLSFSPEGGIRGDNTDAAGLLDALDEPVRGSALVLGAGGAGRAAAWALREAGAQVSVWNRTPARARELAAELGVQHADGPMAADLLVNATAVGLAPEDRLEALPLAEAPIVVDLVYGAAPTPLLRWAAAYGARTVDGLEVLVRQGARSVELWTGREAPIDAMRRALSSPVSSTSAQP
jgi:shikimate dehydrogenase